MGDMIQALITSVSGSGLPLYLADAVPENAAFPYMTAEVVSPCQEDVKGSIHLTLWCVGENANLKRMELHSLLMLAFPRRGTLLTTSAGRYILQTERSDFLQSGVAKGIRLTMGVRFYPAEKEAEQA